MLLILKSSIGYNPEPHESSSYPHNLFHPRSNFLSSLISFWSWFQRRSLTQILYAFLVYPIWAISWCFTTCVTFVVCVSARAMLWLVTVHHGKWSMMYVLNCKNCHDIPHPCSWLLSSSGCVTNATFVINKCRMGCTEADWSVTELAEQEQGT
jgi:hypothetical protein